MRSLTSAQVVDTWERGLDRSLTERMLLLLDAACPAATHEELAAMPLGRRDALLLDLRALLFGPELTGVSECPACGDVLESTFRGEDLRLAAEVSPAAVQHVEVEGLHVAFRLPSSNDVITVTSNPGPAAATQLLERCLDDPASLEGAGVEWETVVSAVARAMSAADPQADVELSLTCPACANRWTVPFDIAAFLWTEIHGWVSRLLRDVDQLARTYGWAEADILALSPNRRNAYLELSRQ